MSIWSRMAAIVWGEWGSTARREECWFRAGQMVVCAPTEPGDWVCADTGRLSPKMPKPGEIYTVDFVYKHNGSFFLSLRELGGLGCHAIQFRPVRETSIECFRALLNSKPGDLPAEREPIEAAR